MEVASVPFLQNIAQAAWPIMPTTDSASSTITPDGPLRQSPSCACARAAASTSGWP